MNFTEHTKIRKEKFGTVVFDTLTEKIFITDEIGADVLALIEEGKDLSDIVNTLSGIYTGQSDVIQGDVVEFIDQLKSNKIIIT